MAILRAINEATVVFDKFHQKIVIDEKDMESTIQKWSCLREKLNFLFLSSPADSSKDHQNRVDYIYESCRLAATIYWSSVHNLIPFSAAVHNEHVLALKAALHKTDIISWLIAAPEAFIWICLTGAAASQQNLERAWFVARMGPIVIALGTEELAAVKEGFSHFQWVAQVCTSKEEQRCLLGTM
jgi:hypothetical protein